MVSKDSVTNMRLFKAHTKQYNKTKRKKNAKIRLKFSKIAEKPVKWYKILINDQKPTNHY